MRRNSKIFPLVVCLLLVLLLVPTSAWAGDSPIRLDTVSLSFPTPQRGYALSLYNCAKKTCATLRGIDDSGFTWSVVPIPSQLVRRLKLVSLSTYNNSYENLNVHFADAKDGWIYGTVPAPVTPNTESPNWVDRLWSTHDGGESWTQIRLNPLSLTGGVIQMATHGKWTYLYGASDQSSQSFLLGTHSNEDEWTSKSSAPMEMPAGGTELEGAFTFLGSSGWFVAGNDRGFTASARLLSNGSWSAWSGPSLGVDSSFTPIVAATRRVLFAEGQSAGFVYPPASSVPPDWNNGATWLFISYDSGATFKPFRELSSSSRGSYYSTAPGLPVSLVPGTILLQRMSGTGSHLMRTTNWGKTWRVVLDHSVAQMLFTSRTTGFAIVDEGSGQTPLALFRTIDAGSNWIRVSE